jgi:hypothetical protein
LFDLSFYKFAFLGQSHKTFFGINILTMFCKLDYCINVTIICLCCERYSFQKEVSEFMPKWSGGNTSGATTLIRMTLSRTKNDSKTVEMLQNLEQKNPFLLHSVFFILLNVVLTNVIQLNAEVPKTSYDYRTYVHDNGSATRKMLV